MCAIQCSSPVLRSKACGTLGNPSQSQDQDIAVQVVMTLSFWVSGLAILAGRKLRSVHTLPLQERTGIWLSLAVAAVMKADASSRPPPSLEMGQVLGKINHAQ